jgi:raffinose/stachyose/melibiose transport system substrate-binding protein
MVRAAVQSWNEENPEHPIEHELFANDVFNERIRTAVGSANAPTLIHSWAGGPLREYVANNQVIDLTDAAAGLLSRVIPAVAANGVVNGRNYAVPNGQSQPISFYYNKEVFEAAGVEVPTTYSELLDVIDALNEHGVTPIALAAGSRWPLLMWIQMLTDRIAGPEVFTNIVDGAEDGWSDPGVTDALNRIIDLVDRGAFGNAFGSVMADQQADLALVHTGTAAMVLHLSSAYPNFLRNAPEFVESGNLGWFAFPEVEGGQGDPRNIVGNPSHFWSVSAHASERNQTTAKEFIETQVLNDDRIEDLLSMGAIPPIEGIEDRIQGRDHEDFMMFTYNQLINAPHFQLSWDQALGGARAQGLLDNLSNIFLGQSDAATFVSNMNGLQ